MFTNHTMLTWQKCCKDIFYRNGLIGLLAKCAQQIDWQLWKIGQSKCLVEIVQRECKWALSATTHNSQADNASDDEYKHSTRWWMISNNRPKRLIWAAYGSIILSIGIWLYYGIVINHIYVYFIYLSVDEYDQVN